MSVYIDDFRAPYKGMFMCHMIADTEDELHKMAHEVGLKPEWFQPKSYPHYDLCLKKKEWALGLGAKAITCRELVGIIKKQRSKTMSNTKLEADVDIGVVIDEVMADVSEITGRKNTVITIRRDEIVSIHGDDYYYGGKTDSFNEVYKKHKQELEEIKAWATGKVEAALTTEAIQLVKQG